MSVIVVIHGCSLAKCFYAGGKKMAKKAEYFQSIQIV